MTGPKQLRNGPCGGVPPDGHCEVVSEMECVWSALRFIDEKVPGITVPAGLIERVETAADPEEECFQVGLELARETMSLPGVAGLHLISFRREAGIARLCRELGIPTRAEREANGYRHPVAV